MKSDRVSGSIRLGQCVVLADLTFDLHVHRVFHFTSSPSSATVHNDNIHCDEHEHKTNDLFDGHHVLGVFLIEKRLRRVGSLLVQSLVTGNWRLLETRAQSVEDCKWLNLSTVRNLINDETGVDVSAKLLPVRDFSIDERVLRHRVSPFVFRL